MEKKVKPAIRKKPAIGLRIVGQTGSVARALLQARAQGYDVIVVSNDDHPEVADWSHLLDITIINHEGPPTEGEPLQSLLDAAFDLGYPGLIYHRNPSKPADYEALEETWREVDGYIVEAESHSIPFNSTRVIVAIPAYNEEASIATVVQECREYAREVLVIDDGSVDQTYERATEAGATVVQHHRNEGYGAAVKTAFREARRRGADHLVLVDGDAQHNPSDIPKLLEKQRTEEAQIVIGSRFIGSEARSIPRYRRMGLVVVNALTNLYLGIIGSDLRISDTQSGFRAYDERAIQSLAETQTLTDDMDASVEILYHAIDEGFHIAEVETTVNYPPDAESSYHPVYHGAILMRNILFNLERVRPSLFPGVLGLLGLGFGLTLVGWILSELLSLHVAVLGVIAGVSILIGLVMLVSAVVSRAILIH